MLTGSHHGIVRFVSDLAFAASGTKCCDDAFGDPSNFFVQLNNLITIMAYENSVFYISNIFTLRSYVGCRKETEYET